MTTSNPKSRSALRDVVWAGVAGVLVLAVLECGARVAVTVDQDRARARKSDAAAWAVHSPTIGWKRKPGYRGDVDGVEREYDREGFFTCDTPQLSDSSSLRVLFLGDSNTHGQGVRTEDTFAEIVERRVPGIAAINGGVPGYTSYQGRLALDKYLPKLTPRLVVVSFNYNDRRYVLSPDEADGPAVFERADRASRHPLHRAARVLEYSAFYRSLRSAMRAAGLSPRAPDAGSLDGVAPRVSPEDYRANLLALGEAARRAGVPMIYVLLRDNPLQSDHLHRGIDRFASRDVEGGMALLEAAIREENSFSDLARQALASVQREQGDSAAAARTLASGRLFRSQHGGTPVRLDSEYNDILREVAAQLGARVVDAGALLEAHPGDYIDQCHFDAAGHRRIGEAIAQAVVSALGESPTPREE